MRLALLTWALAIMACVTAGAQTPATAATRLTADDMRVAAQMLIDAGRAEQALDLADALLARDPGDVRAMILKSQALRDLGRTDEAAAVAADAWSGTQDRRLKFGAAMVRAQALASGEQRTAAQLWLRRAAHVAPDPGARAEAEEAFAYVRSRNPWVFRFHFAAAPSSNVNNGSRRNSFWFYGFPVELNGAARALSGYEATAGVQATYRLLPGEYSTTELTFSAMHKAVSLSSEARRIAPAARGSDFAFTALEAGIWHQIDQGRLPFGTGLGATLGHNWYGGADLSDYLQLRAEFDRSIGPKDALQLALGAERSWRRDSTVQSADEATAALRWLHVLPNRDRLQASVGMGRTWSQSTEMAHEARSLRLSWTKARPVAGLRLSAGLGFEARDYARSRYAPGGRQDERVSADLSVTFERMDYMGFVPTLNLNAGETRSNVGLFDARDMGLSLGFESAF